MALRRNWLFADTVAGYLKALLVESPEANAVDDHETLLPWRIAMTER